MILSRSRLGVGLALLTVAVVGCSSAAPSAPSQAPAQTTVPSQTAPRPGYVPAPRPEPVTPAGTWISNQDPGLLYVVESDGAGGFMLKNPGTGLEARMEPRINLGGWTFDAGGGKPGSVGLDERVDTLMVRIEGVHDDQFTRVMMSETGGSTGSILGVWWDPVQHRRLTITSAGSGGLIYNHCHPLQPKGAGLYNLPGAGAVSYDAATDSVTVNAIVPVTLVRSLSPELIDTWTNGTRSLNIGKEYWSGHFQFSGPKGMRFLESTGGWNYNILDGGREVLGSIEYDLNADAMVADMESTGLRGTFKRSADCSLSEAAPAPVTVGNKRIVRDADGLNLRESPSTAARAITVLPQGELLEVLQVQDPWLQVKTARETGWVSGIFTSPVVLLVVEEENALLSSGVSLKQPPIGNLPKGEVVVFLKHQFYNNYLVRSSLGIGALSARSVSLAPGSAPPPLNVPDGGSDLVGVWVDKDDSSLFYAIAPNGSGGLRLKNSSGFEAEIRCGGRKDDVSEDWEIRDGGQVLGLVGTRPIPLR